MAWNLGGRVALITGAGSGIGAELARQLAAKGMRPALIDVNGEALEAVAAGLPGAEWAVADVRDASAVSSAVDSLAARCGGIDLCIANAGIATGGPLRLVGADTVEDTIEVNLLGVWRTVRACLPYVVPARGHVLMVASAAAILPSGGLGAYSAAKAGVEALGRSLRIEVRHHGVTVQVAYYLFLNTPMVQAGEFSPVFAAARQRPSGPIGKVWPLEPAIARTVKSIEKRARMVLHPPGLRALFFLRGVLDNPLTDRLVGSSMPGIEQAFAREAERVGASAAARAVGRRP